LRPRRAGGDVRSRDRARARAAAEQRVRPDPRGAEGLRSGAAPPPRARTEGRMSGLGRDAQALIARGKSGDAPSAADRARLLEKLEARWAGAPAPPPARGLFARLRARWLWTSLSAVVLLPLGAWFAPRATPTRPVSVRVASPPNDALRPLPAAGE